MENYIANNISAWSRFVQWWAGIWRFFLVNILNSKAEVGALIDKDRACWNEITVNLLFFPHGALSILKIPISKRLLDDKLLIACHKNGTFNIKSSYHLVERENLKKVSSFNLCTSVGKGNMILTGSNFWKLSCEKSKKFYAVWSQKYPSNSSEFG